MRSYLTFSLLVILQLFSVLYDTPVAAQAPAVVKISDVGVSVRQDLQGNDALRLRTPAIMTNHPVDEIRVELPRKIAEQVSADYLPPGWGMQVNKKLLIFSGPPLVDLDSAYLRIGLGSAQAPKKLDLSLFSGGRRLYGKSHLIPRQPPLSLIEEPVTVLAMPEFVIPGDTIEFSPLTMELTPPGGRWFIGGRPGLPVPDGDQEEAEGGKDSKDGTDFSFTTRYRVRLGRKGDLSLSVRYETEWGETLVDADAAEGTKVVDGPDIEPSVGWITNCTPKSFAGSNVCVCGWFPEAEVRDSLLIDGRPLGPPVNSSTRVATVRLPGDLEPGLHVITGRSAAGSAQVTILAIGGEIDQNKLLRGESTPLRLWVRGTEDVVQMTLRNNTPGIVRL